MVERRVSSTHTRCNHAILLRALLAFAATIATNWSSWPLETAWRVKMPLFAASRTNAVSKRRFRIFLNRFGSKNRQRIKGFFRTISMFEMAVLIVRTRHFSRRIHYSFQCHRWYTKNTLKKTFSDISNRLSAL